MIAARVLGWLETRADRANPMLVRRVRQELRNKAFIGAYLLMLLVAVVAATIFASTATGRDGGRGMFAVIASAWSALMCIQALATSRAIAGDRGAAAWDLIELTGMHPLRLVGGVVQSSLLLGLFGAAGLAPFLVMSYLLRGLDLPTVLFALVTLPMLGALLGAIAAAAACVGSNRQARQGLGLLLALGLLVAWGMLIGLWANSEHTVSELMAEVLRGTAEAIIILGLLVNGWLAAMAVALALGATLLTHRALDRSSLLRLVWCLVWLNGLLWLGGMIGWLWHDRGWDFVRRDLDDALGVTSAIGVGWTLVLALFATTEDIDLTPRQQQAVTGGGRLRRLAMAVLGPGSGRGARCTMLLLVPSLALAGPWLLEYAGLLLASFGLFVLMLGDLLARGPLRRFCQTATARRICTVAVFCFLSVAPPLVALGLRDSGGEDWLFAVSPVAGLVQFGERDWRGGYEIILSYGLGLVGFAWLLLRCRTPGGGQARVTAREDDANPRG